jgi:hypothetical protein
MTHCIRTAITALALAMSLSSGRAEPALSGAPDAAGSGIAPKNIILDDDFALYADGMAAHTPIRSKKLRRETLPGAPSSLTVSLGIVASLTGFADY